MLTLPFSSRARLVAELALTVALGAVLDLFRIPLPHLLYGGSLSLEGLPIVLTGLRRGWRAGALAGAAFGVVSFLTKPIVMHPAQLLLDYPIAYALLGWGCALTVGGAAGVPWTDWPARLRVVGGIVVGHLLRLAAHFVSGVLFFGAYAPPEQPVWLYSLMYNCSYLAPQMIAHVLLAQLVLARIGSHHQ